MSKKPTIKIVYPEASEKALLLTEAMVKRAPGKRVVETESEDPIFPDGGELFSGFIRCKTQTGVELTLTLNPSSMDYALETLIRPNLTADEKKRILGDSASGDDMFSAQATEAPGQTLDGGSSPDAPSDEREAATPSEEQEETAEVGAIPEKALRSIIVDAIDKAAKGHGTFDAVNHAISEINNYTEAKLVRVEPEFAVRLAVLLAYAEIFTTKKAATDRWKTLNEFAVETIRAFTAGSDGLLRKAYASLSLEMDKNEKPESIVRSYMTMLTGVRSLDMNNDYQTDIEPGLLDDIDEQENSCTDTVGSASLADNEEEEMHREPEQTEVPHG